MKSTAWVRVRACHFRFALLMGVSALSACAQYKWVHPKLPEALADKAAMQCEAEALQLYPVVVAYDVYGGNSKGQGTECKTGKKGPECKGGGTLSVDSSVYSKDINEQSRNTRIAACMRAAGWHKVEIPRQ